MTDIEARYRSLRKARKLFEKGLGIAEISEMVGLGKSTLYKYLGKKKSKTDDIDLSEVRKMRKTHTLAQVAKHFGVSQNWVHCRTLDIKTKPRDGHSSHPLYKYWYQIKEACTNPQSKNYANYGGRGVTFCETWLDFPSFLNDVKHLGKKPKGKYLSMLDPRKGFVPGNLEWATLRERTHKYEKHLAKKYKFKNEDLTLLEISEKYKIPYPTVYRYRLCLAGLELKFFRGK